MGDLAAQRAVEELERQLKPRRAADFDAGAASVFHGMLEAADRAVVALVKDPPPSCGSWRPAAAASAARG